MTMKQLLGAIWTWRSHPYVMFHLHGASLPCGNPAFYLSQKPTPGSPARSAVIRTLEGRRVRHGGAMICGSCGSQIDGLRSRDVYRRGW